MCLFLWLLGSPGAAALVHRAAPGEAAAAALGGSSAWAEGAWDVTMVGWNTTTIYSGFFHEK